MAAPTVAVRATGTFSGVHGSMAEGAEMRVPRAVAKKMAEEGYPIEVVEPRKAARKTEE